MKTSDLVGWLKKNPLPVACTFVSAVLAAVVYFRSDNVSDERAELERSTTEEERYALNIRNGVQLKEQFDALTAANAQITARLIRASQLGINQQFFYILESDSGAKLLDVHQNARPTTKGAFLPIGFSVTVQGKFEQVLSFMRSLEGGPHYCRITAATCTGARTGSVTLVLNLELLGLP